MSSPHPLYCARTIVLSWSSAHDGSEEYSGIWSMKMLVLGTAWTGRMAVRRRRGRGWR